MESETGTSEYELKLKESLSEYFNKLSCKIKDQCKIEVENQWNPFKEGKRVRKYSPRIDIAVGPFAYREKRYIEEYDKLSEASNQFITSLLSRFKGNSRKYSFNIYSI